MFFLIFSLILGTGYFLFHYNDSPTATQPFHTSSGYHYFLPTASEADFNDTVNNYDRTYNEALNQLDRDSKLVNVKDSVKAVLYTHQVVQSLLKSKDTDAINYQRAIVNRILDSVEKQAQLVNAEANDSTNTNSMTDPIG